MLISLMMQLGMFSQPPPPPPVVEGSILYDDGQLKRLERIRKIREREEEEILVVAGAWFVNYN